MKGSEKQIKWASEIRECVIDILNGAIKEDERVKEPVSKIINVLNDDNTYAGDIIEVFMLAPEKTRGKTINESFGWIITFMKLTTVETFKLSNFR